MFLSGSRHLTLSGAAFLEIRPKNARIFAERGRRG
jgi:hypothetical protein